MALLAILAMCSAFSAYAQEVITIGEPNWTSGRAMAGLVKVAIVPGTNAVIFKGMDRSKGEFDVHPDVWIPNQNTARRNTTSNSLPKISTDL